MLFKRTGKKHATSPKRISQRMSEDGINYHHLIARAMRSRRVLDHLRVVIRVSHSERTREARGLAERSRLTPARSQVTWICQEASFTCVYRNARTVHGRIVLRTAKERCKQKIGHIRGCLKLLQLPRGTSV